MSKKSTSKANTRVSLPNTVFPASRKEIARLAHDVRHSVGLDNVMYFPVMDFFESMLTKIVPDFEYDIVAIEEMPDREGDTDVLSHRIKIREDVYEKAINGDGRSRFTIMHEVGHLMLHSISGIPFKRPHGYRMSKSKKKKIRAEKPAFVDEEWQANVFAGEILMDSRLIGQLSIEEISRRCGTSHDAAMVQYNKLHQSDTIEKEFATNNVNLN